ncbi:uncharacterized protein B0P05DRAFT_567102 [Gilbertella persicaria]|uniref:uncharacterized protein n=1 Tax=Gilbertella persicaria TaxID=101096 RepID=UPI0022207F2B|nr:uncharacterized protein B0P05DRAFT_567102 [Gilbertella persicaria]KAI8047042.1 hypothetical protein B0P05DRAFT_567102 [Gilbertella persicaria]
MSSVHLVEGKRILCTADVRGNISELNRLARDFNADYIIHTGDFGFYDRSSLDRIGDRPLKHWIQYTTLIPAATRSRILAGTSDQIYRTIEQSPQTLLSEFSDYLAGNKTLDVPVYTVWGACEDVAIIEKFRSGQYRIENLFLLDEASTHVLELSGVSLRLFGLGGAVVQHKLFDNGEGTDTIAGGLGVMWTTALQIGELVELAASVYDPTETRVLVTHASPGREGLLAQLALTLHADFTISAGLHFRYNIAYNEFACQPEIDHFRNRLLQSQQQFMQLWDAIKEQVEDSVDEHQYTLLRNALNVVNRIPPSLQDLEPGSDRSSAESAFWERDELAYKNMWNFNLPDAAYGSLMFTIHQGIIASEMKSYGLNFSYRKQQASSPVLEKPNSKSNEDTENTSTTASTTPPPSSINSHHMSNTNYRNSKRQSMQPRNLYTAYVGGLSNTTVTEDDIRAYFGHDNVTSIKFPIDSTTQLPKAHCYVEFVNAQALEAALAKNGMIYRDNKLIINRPNTQYNSPDRRASTRGRGGRGYRDSRVMNNDH